MIYGTFSLQTECAFSSKVNIYCFFCKFFTGECRTVEHGTAAEEDIEGTMIEQKISLCISELSEVTLPFTGTAHFAERKVDIAKAGSCGRRRQASQRQQWLQSEECRLMLRD